MLNGSQIQRIYLDELGDPSEQAIGIRLMQLTITPPEQAAEQARELIRQTNQEDTGFLSKKEIIDMICTISVYKFSKLSREEVEAMLGLSLEETRVYQDASEKGRQKGKLEGEQTLILRQLNHRVGAIAPETEAQIKTFSLIQLETLGEALLDFSSPVDLDQWMQSQSIPGGES